MSKFDRKIKRQQAKHKKKQHTKEINEKLALTEQISHECLVCQKHFDKSDMQAIDEWYVVVRDSNTVNLYCPECWVVAHKTVVELQNPPSLEPKK
jgi:hypothetical protein